MNMETQTEMIQEITVLVYLNMKRKKFLFIFMMDPDLGVQHRMISVDNFFVFLR